MSGSGGRSGLAALGAAALAALLGLAVVELPMPVVALQAEVRAQLPQSGVDHPVTAVLLNFRSYDTLLEIAVLLVAVITGLAARQALPDQDRPRHIENTLLVALLHGLLPVLLLTAAYLLWAGATQPGGAFQAGAVLAAAGVLLRLAGAQLPAAETLASRIAMLAGFMLFLLVAIGTLLGGRAFLAYPPAWAGALILLIEAGLSLSIGVILLGLFAAAPPPRNGLRRRR